MLDREGLVHRVGESDPAVLYSYSHRGTMFVSTAFRATSMSFPGGNRQP